MDILKKYKLYLIDSINCPFPEWTMCEKLLGNLGKIKYDEYVYIDGGYIYYHDSKNGNFCLSYANIWKVFEDEIKLNHSDIQQLTKIYIENTYNLKGIITHWNVASHNRFMRLSQKYIIENTYNLKGINTNMNYS
jgi:hypothetical protein